MFIDRRDAGRRLGQALAPLRQRNPVVIGLPRGGVVVADEVARALDAPLDILVVRKLGAPGQPELGLGAIAEGGVTALNDRLIDMLGVHPSALAAVAAHEHAELERRVRTYRGNRPPFDVSGRMVILVDDGLATGYTARAAARALRARAADSIVLAVPVAAPETAEELKEEVDDVVALETPRFFGAVGQWYQDFSQTSDAEVLAILERRGDAQHPD